MLKKYRLEQHVQTYNGTWYVGSMGDYETLAEAEKDKELFEGVIFALVNSGNYRDAKYVIKEVAK